MTNESNSVDQKPVAVVTGSSSGIGSAIAVGFAKVGYEVVIHGCRNESGAKETAQLIEDFGHDSCVILADLSDRKQREQFVESAWNWRGKVNVWVNNAGADVLTGDAASFSFEEKLELLWQTDVVSTMMLSRLTAERMNEAQQGGVITNIGWDQAANGMAGDSGEMFSAIKGAIMAFTKSFAQSVAPSIRVNCVAPGWIQTSWGNETSEYWDHRAKSESLMNRWGKPDDIANAVVFLASQDASFIAGQTINVNGGFRFSPKISAEKK